MEYGIGTNFGANKYSNAPALGAAGGKLYALIDDCGKNPQLYALNSGTLEKSGSALNVKLVASPEIFDKSGCPAVIYGDFFGKKTEAKILELDGWKSIVTEPTAQTPMTRRQRTEKFTFSVHITNNLRN